MHMANIQGGPKIANGTIVFAPRNVTYEGPRGASKNFPDSLSLAIFYGPLINCAIIRPLNIIITFGSKKSKEDCCNNLIGSIYVKELGLLCDPH